MDFNIDDYTENINYCKYVFNKNKELNLGLDNPIDIQVVANYYVDEIIELNDGHIGEEIVDNELVLFEVINEYMSNIKDKFSDSESIYHKPKDNDELTLYSQIERIKNSRGGYGYNGSYNDLGNDEVNFSENIRL